MKENMTYEEALAELEKTIVEIENPNVPLDGVAANVKKAVALLEYCRKSLKDNEEIIEKILK